MAIKYLSGGGSTVRTTILSNTTLNTALTIDATGEIAAYIGPVFFPARTGTKAIRKVHFRFGTVVKAGGSGLTLSLQDVSTSAQARPDEVQDQTYAIANGDAGFTSNVWYTTGNLSADRTVTYGEMLAVVIEYDGSGRLSADSVIITPTNTGAAQPTTYCALKTGGTWATQNIIPNVILEMSDGTFGTLGVTYLPFTTVAATTYNSGSAIDEYGIKFVPNYPMVVDLLQAGVIQSNANQDFDIVLYSDTTPLATASFDGTQTAAVSANYQAFTRTVPKVELVAGSPYIISVKPTTANSISVYTYNVNAFAHFAGTYPIPGYIGVVSRTDGGSWSAPNDTQYLAISFGNGGGDDGVQIGGILSDIGINGGLIG